jgi:transcriptional regulator with XRE-family HTH domain
MKNAKQKNTPRDVTGVDKHIGARMREGRTAMGISQAALGQKLAISFQQVQKHENGGNRVSAARLFDICGALELSLTSMYERKLEL